MRTIELLKARKYHVIAFLSLSLICLFYTSAYISYSSLNVTAERSENIAEIFKPTAECLIKKGVDSSFIVKLFSNEKTVFNEKYVKINVTGYLKKSGSYAQFYDDKSIDKNISFIKNNLELFQKAEAKYNVSKEVIASILWIETKHGTYLGNNQLPSVFLSTSLVNSSEYIKLNIAAIDSSQYNKKEYKELVEKIYKRSEKKANWAVNELVAMYQAEKKYNINFNEIYGSWAGAFGMSQFLPSSFLKFAVDGNSDGKIDLFSIEDAIFSVANYLKLNGWGDNESKQRKAVYSYNNSTAYVDAVLILAQKTSQK